MKESLRKTCLQDTRNIEARVGEILNELDSLMYDAAQIINGSVCGSHRELQEHWESAATDFEIACDHVNRASGRLHSAKSYLYCLPTKEAP